MKIALALIVKGDDKEAAFLSRCLRSIMPFVDGAFVTITHKKGQKRNAKCEEYAKSFKCQISDFEWVDDFAAARNFNFSQVPKEYDYILWCDADDIMWRFDTVRKLMEEEPEIDAWTMQYYYDKDEYNNPTVIHTKTQIVRNDGCVSWIGRIHEDFKENREMKVKYLEDAKRIHTTTTEHSAVAFERNLKISKIDAKENPNDPRSWFNLANSLYGVGRAKEAKVAFFKFMKGSQSESEKYIAYQRLALCEKNLGNKDKAIEYLQLSIGLMPEFPDSFNQLGYMLFDFGMLDQAEKYLLIGLMTKPQYQRMVFYNPRDYDYNPMMALAKVYFNKNRPDLALPMLKGCLKIYPDDTKTKGLVDEMEKETGRLEKVIEAIKHIETLGDDKEKILYTINKLPVDLQSHPAVCRIRNQYIVKTESTGKDIAYYCGETQFEWNPILFKTKGFGGSEEAVINLSKEWVNQGYNVTVYNSCGIDPIISEGVTYKPWWMFNGKDKWDHLILWRSPKLADYEMNASNVYIDLHDVISEGEFTEKRLKRIKKIMVKTRAHRALFPNIPDEKFAVIHNGIDFGLFSGTETRDPYLLINTSSPDRSMDVLPKLFKEVKKRVPQARLVWAYGWNNYDSWFANDKRMMEWKEKIVAEMKEAGIEDLGRLPQHECAKLYQKGRIFAYPSDFYEIDCISLNKAQAAGCFPITTDFAAIGENNLTGVKVHTDRTIKDWSLPYQVGYGTKYEKAQKEWVDVVVDKLQRPMDAFIPNFPSIFSWHQIGRQWSQVFS